MVNLWKKYDSKKTYDEYLNSDHKLRRQAVIISHILERHGIKKLNEIEKNCASTINARGINFRVYSSGKKLQEKKWPLDIIPRIILKKDWAKVSKGLLQRVKSNISGVDLIRNINGEFMVLEDNLRVPSGVSYMLENRMVMRDVFPELFTKYKVSSVHQYPNKLYHCMLECVPRKTRNPHMCVLTPGRYNSAYFEHRFLAEQMGIALVEGKDLFVEKDFVYMKTVTGPMKVDCIYRRIKDLFVEKDFAYMKTVTGPMKVDCIYRRIDDNFLDPKVFYKHSLLGVPGLFKCWRKGNVGIVNAPGTGIADDKAIYSYVDKMIKFYLDEEPKLKQVQTFLCRKKIHKDHVIENISKLVVKPTNGSGGNGILIGPKASKEERENMIDKIKSKPSDYIAQPLEILSTTPTISEEGIEPRHLDLRPFVLTGKKSWVTTGGLTRVALKKGSTIVNSSQGGGSKDTLVIER